MTTTTLLAEFVKDAYRAGKRREEITEALRAAGWPQEQLDAYWAKYHTSDFPVPVPLPALYASPRLTTLNIFHFVVLYITLFSVISIVFTFLDYNLPDGHGQMRGLYYSQYTPIADTIREYLAALLVALPLTIWSLRALNKAMRTTGQFIHGTRLRLLNITLFIASMILLGNAISFIYYLLSGELSLRFFIKVIILSVIGLGGYFYFKPEMAMYEKKA